MNYLNNPGITFSLASIPTAYTPKEYLLLDKKAVTAFLLTYTGKRGDLYISYIPSINARGYGKTEEEAQKTLTFQVAALFNAIFELQGIRRTRELQSLGWTQSNYFKKKYSSTLDDKQVILEDFDNPELVKRGGLQAAWGESQIILSVKYYPTMTSILQKYIQETDILLVNLSFNLNQTSEKAKLPSSEFGEREF